MAHTAAATTALQHHYAPPKWLTATEVQVPDKDGLRFIDCVAIDLTSPHPELHGVEIKISRGDWLSELRKPEKSAAATEQVDKHYLLAERHVFRDDEVPDDWGILLLEDGRISEHRAAKRLTPRKNAPTWGRALMTAVMRRVAAHGGQQATLREVERAAEARGYRKGLNAGKRRSDVVVRRGTAKPRYDPGRYNLDDGIPLDLP